MLSVLPPVVAVAVCVIVAGDQANTNVWGIDGMLVYCASRDWIVLSNTYVYPQLSVTAL